MKYTLLSGLCTAAFLLASCGAPVATNTNINAPEVTTPLPPTTGTTLPAASEPESLVRALAAQLNMQGTLSPATVAWTLGEGQYQTSIPAQGVSMTGLVTGNGGDLMQKAATAQGLMEVATIATTPQAITYGLEKYPEVCTWTMPTDALNHSQNSMTIACGTIDEARVQKSAQTLPKSEALFAALSDKFGPSTTPEETYLLWHDAMNVEKQQLLRARSVYFSDIDPQVFKKLLIDLGYKPTGYSTEGTVTGSQAFEKEGFGCLFTTSVRGWEKAVEEGTVGEGMFTDPEGKTEMTASCAMLQ